LNTKAAFDSVTQVQNQLHPALAASGGGPGCEIVVQIGAFIASAALKLDRHIGAGMK
jgi:hypothetical protein